MPNIIRPSIVPPLQMQAARRRTPGHPLGAAGCSSLLCILERDPITEIDMHNKATFCNKKSPKTEVFEDFWSCWADLNRRPHPYQATLVLFSNHFSCFMIISTPIHLLSVTLCAKGLRLFHRPLWLVVWSNCLGNTISQFNYLHKSS